MRKLLGMLGALLLLAVAIPASLSAQQFGSVLGSATAIHRGDGVGTFFAPAYSTWQAIVIQGNSTTGAGTSIIVVPQGGGPGGTITLQDGSAIQLASIFNTSTPIRVQDANAETVTPTGVTIAACSPGFLGVGSSNICVTITGNFSNTHGASAYVGSGDGGIEEAVADAGANGGGLVYWEADCGAVTLNTGGLTTTTTNCQVPLSFISMAGSAVVKTTITTATSFSLGTTTTTTAFVNGCTNLTAGLNCQQFQAAPTKVAGASLALTPILITAAGGTPGAGVVHVKAFGYSQVNSAQ